MATIPGLGEGRYAMRVDPAVQQERDQERLRILKTEEQDHRLPAEARAAVGREIGRMGGAPAQAVTAAVAPPLDGSVPLVPPKLAEDPALLDLRRRYEAATAATVAPSGLLGLYGDQIGAATKRRLADPGPPQEASWGTWAATKALLGSGPVAGGLEFSGSAADVASGAAAPLASTGASAGGMFAMQSDAERRQEEEARQRMLKGPAFDPTIGNVLRAKAQEFAPDPLTAHRSTQIIHGLSAGVTKAVGSALAFGAIPGAVVFGAEEGNTIAQNLIVEGVDPATAAKVGAVTGIASAVGAGLPVAGGTIAKTAALALVGGPGTYVAQEALSKKILQEAGYTAQAEMHDPTDPVMLALSTVIPGAFGALALRQAARAKARHVAEAPIREAANAKVEADALAKAGDIQPHDSVTIHAADADATARAAAGDLVAVDAARVHVLDSAEAKHIPPDMPLGNERGTDVIRDSVASGDMGPAVKMVAEQEALAPLQTDTPQFKAWFGGSQVVDAQGAPLVVYHGTNRPIDTFDLSKLDAPEGIHLTADPQVASGYSVSRDMGGQGGSNVMPLYVRAEKVQDVPIITSDGAREAQQAGFDAIRSGTHLVVFDPARIKSAIGNSGRFDPGSASLTDRAPVSAAAPPRDTGAPEGPPQAEQSASAKPSESIETPEQGASRLQSAVDELAVADPDRMVTLPGSDTPIKLSEALEQIKNETDAMREHGDYVKAAATCALMSGV